MIIVPTHTGTSFAPPTITALTPGSLTAGTAGNVTISGANFVPGSTTVTVGGSGRAVTVNSSTQLTVSFPGNSRGSYTVAVTTPGGTALATFTYIVIPSISSISPSSVIIGTNTTYTLFGSGFTTGSQPYIYIGAPEDTYVNPNGGATDTSCSFTYNFTSAGTRTVYIAGFDAWSNGANISVVAPAPSISSVNDGRNGNGAQPGSPITVSGSNFNIGTTSVSIGGTAVSASVSSSSVSFTCPNLGGDGSRNVTITTSAGSASRAIQFWGSRAASTTTFTSGSGSFTPPQWANFMGIVCIGGGGGGGAGGILAWGGGGSAGSYGVTTRNLLNTGFGARSYSVGAAGLNGGAKGVNQPGDPGTASTADGVTGGGGAAGCGFCNGTAGTSTSAISWGGVGYPNATGGGFGNSADAGPNPGSGGGGGNSGGGPFPGKPGRAGAVYFRVYQ